MRIFIVAAVLAALSITSAFASNPAAFLPPQRFNHSYKGKIVIHQGNYFYVAWHCGPGAYSCSPVGGRKGVCDIIVSALESHGPGRGAIDQAGYRNLIRHERGHSNGWPASHPK